MLLADCDLAAPGTPAPLVPCQALPTPCWHSPYSFRGTHGPALLQEKLAQLSSRPCLTCEHSLTQETSLGEWRGIEQAPGHK